VTDGEHSETIVTAGNGCRVTVHAYNADDELDSTQLRLLSQGEYHRSMRYQSRRDRRRWTVARVRLRQILGRLLDQPPESVALRCLDSGKPVVQSDRPLHFSLSHAGSHVLVATSEDAVVGVDLEPCRPMEDLPSLASIALSAQERRSVFAMDVSAQSFAFLRLWTCKEAVLKATGEGLRGLSNVDLTRTVACGADGNSWFQDLQGRWLVRPFRVSDQVISAVAVTTEACRAELDCVDGTGNHDVTPDRCQHRSRRQMSDPSVASVGP